MAEPVTRLAARSPSAPPASTRRRGDAAAPCASSRERAQRRTIAVPAEVLRQVRLVELRTRGLVNSLFTGEYHSVFKGQGMEFAEVREYQPGDEVRTIDWNVTARMRPARSSSATSRSASSR